MSSQKRVLVLITLFLFACSARKPGEPIKPGFNMYSAQQDIEIGKQASAEIRQQVDIVENEELQRYAFAQIGVDISVEHGAVKPIAFEAATQKKGAAAAQ